MKNQQTKNLLLVALGLCSSAALATEYDDPWWTNPNVNSSFVDHFNGSSIDRSKWLVEKNIFVNGEDIDYQDVEYPAADWTFRVGQDDPAALDGKVLNLKARYMDGEIQDYYGGVAGEGKPIFIRAGRIESQITDDSTFVFGKFEARIKMPPARNAEFPAWWLLGNFPDVGWTACQELDIVEFTGNNVNTIPQTHWSAPYAIYGGNPNPVTYSQFGINPSNQYVTYGVIKTPEYVEYYVNGVKTYTWSRENMGEEQPFPYVTPMRMILNHAITHVEWPDVGNYNAFSTNPNVANKTGYTRVVNGVTEYEYLDTAAMNQNIGRAGTDFLVDYVAHWPLPPTDASYPYIDESKYSFFRESNNTDGFYPLKGWLAPVAVTGDDYDKPGTPTDFRDNAPDNAADGYVGSKWATPKDDNLHWVEVDYGSDKNIKYFWIEWAWNLPKSYDIYGKTSSGAWEHILTSDQDATGWATHTFDVNKTYRYIKLVTKGRIDKSDSIWLLEFKAFEDVANVYPKPAGTAQVDRTVNMLSNGNFTAGLEGWGTESFDGATPNYSVVGGEARITTGNQGANSGSIQMHTSSFGLKRNYRYQISFRARASAARDIQLRLAENTLNPSGSGTYLTQTIALGTGMNTYTYNLDFTAADNPGRLAFLMGGMGTATVYIDDVVIREITYIGSGDPLVPAIASTNFVSASSGWETEWWGAAQRAVDGATGNKASSREGFEGQDQSVNIRIDPHYEIKEVLVAGDNSAPRSLDQFRVTYGSNTLMNWTPSTTDGVYESFTNFANQPPVSQRDFTLHFRPPAGQLVEVSDVQFMAIDHMPHRIYTIALDGGGSISPAGTVRYNRNGTDSATYTFTPPAGRAVANVIVDGVSQGPLNSYTFNGISASHTLAVAFTSSGQPNSSSSSSVPSSSSSSVSSSSSSSGSVVLVSNGRPTFSSTALTPASNAVDGDAGTRWESAHGVDPSWMTVDLGSARNLARVEIDWEAANAAVYDIQGSNDNSNWTTLKTVTGGTFGARTDTETVSGSYRYVRINGTQRSAGNSWGYSIWELRVFANSGSASSSSASSVGVLTPAAATASTSFQPAALAIDNNGGTRWESDHGVSPSWLRVDLGTARNLSKVEIDWEAANAANYTVEGSNNGTSWTNLATHTGGTFGARTDSKNLSGSYRYVRINATQRSAGNTWGYSIFEVRVFGN